jgi:hypothetical protein
VTVRENVEVERIKQRVDLSLRGPGDLENTVMHPTRSFTMICHRSVVVFGVAMELKSEGN